MTEIEWQQETEVIVIGGGLAGHCAAHEAARNGAEVLLLEKQSEIGGSTVLSGGFLAFAGTDLQKAAGIDDGNELLINDLRNAGGLENDGRLLHVYADHQLAAYEWLRSAGVTFKGVQLSSAHSVPRAHATDPQVLMKLVAEVAQHTGRVRTLLSSPAERLIRLRHGEPVAGVLAKLGGKIQAIRARRGVVLAAGGFSRNAEMLKTFAPGQSKAVQYGGAGNTGDGIRMAWALGAGLRDMGYIKGTFGFHPDARVVDVFGAPIDGLFAAGELMGGFHGVAYMTGSSLGKCIIFGRIADAMRQGWNDRGKATRRGARSFGIRIRRNARDFENESGRGG